jgi:hypothetical protein
MGVDDDGLNNAIGPSRHWPSVLRFLRGILSAVFFVVWAVLTLRAVQLLPSAAKIFKAPGIPLTDEDGKFMIYATLFTERIVQVSMWLLMYIMQLIGVKNKYETLLVLVAVGVSVWFAITRYSQDSVRAATIANNDDSDSDDE